MQLAILIITKKLQLCLFKEATACMSFICCEWPPNLLYLLVPRALRPCLVPNFFKIFRHIECLDTCMEH
jgi:hypothetical protein